MDELWTTILAPVLDATRPGLILEVTGGEERPAGPIVSFVGSWGARVQRWRWQPGDRPPGGADLVLLDRDAGASSVGDLLDAVVAIADAAGRPLPVIVVQGVEADAARLAATNRLAEGRDGCEVLVVPGLGGVAIVTAAAPLARDAGGPLGRLLAELSPSRALARHLTAVENRRLVERARAEQAWERLTAAREGACEHEALLAERDELRARLRDLAGAALASVAPAAPPTSSAESAAAAPPSDSAAPLPMTTPAGVAAAHEPTQADIRELLNPSELLAELGWDGPEQDLGLPVPTNVMPEGQQCEWEWPLQTAGPAMPAVAYLLPGLPPEGSGGSHSLVQEARGLRALGALASVCVPLDALARAERLYGNDDGLFVAYLEEDEVVQAVGAATVVVSTEHTSVRLAERVVAERPEVLCAYYVQDYEPLFAPPSSARSDHALLSYRAIPGQVLFAKTHWLRNVVMARHGVSVMKVQPSLDTELFNPLGRSEQEGSLRVAAMIRPRTPRRRARATLIALEAIARRLGDCVQTTTFGCDEKVFAELRSAIGSGAPAVTHRGLLTRADVAGVMRRSDVFIDASAYQAFGRTGLEAMACGAVPVLPALGGVGEYAAHDRDAVILERDSPEEIADAVCLLASDRERLDRLRAAGLRSASRFSIERAARSQLGLFATVTTPRLPLTTVTA